MIWRISEIELEHQYRLHLCQSNEGRRFFRLIEIGCDQDLLPKGDVVKITDIVSNDLLKARNFQRISDSVGLTSGERFFVDAHGVWLAFSEISQIRAGIDFEDIDWITKASPDFPPM